MLEASFFTDFASHPDAAGILAKIYSFQRSWPEACGTWLSNKLLTPLLFYLEKKLVLASNALMQILSIMQNGKWTPGIGDPTVIGWVIVLAYIAAAGLCAGCAYNARKNPQKKQLAFWLTITIILTLLAINKQLDLQTWLTATARRISRQQGWYQQRHTFQAWGVSVIAAVGGCFVLLTGRIMRNYGRYRLALVGLILLLVFIVIRAASFHAVDNVLVFKIAGLKIRHFLELGAIACIGISAGRCFFSKEKVIE